MHLLTSASRFRDAVSPPVATEGRCELPVRGGGVFGRGSSGRRASRLLECPATVRYCLSKTNVAVRGLPSTSVPLAAWVRVLPSLEMTFVPVTWYFPPVFFTSDRKSTRLNSSHL